jgi:hypothetical protein
LTQKIFDALFAFTQALVARRRQHFHSVTGREDQALADEFAINERAQAFGAGFVRESQTLAHRDGRGFVIESDEND